MAFAGIYFRPTPILPRLWMWSNDYDFVIARTRREAVQFAMHAYGYSEADLAETTWYIMPASRHFCYQEEIHHISHTTPVIATLGLIIRDRPVQWFINTYGEGYFACSEF